MTSAERRARTTTLFHEALAKPVEGRLAYLKEASTGDPELFAKVRVYLEAYAEVATAVVPNQNDGPGLALESIDTLIDLGDRYEQIKFLGRGGMGVVYRAYDREIGKLVALKTLKPELASDTRVVERLRNETRLALDIAHRNVCRINELERINDRFLIKMEYVDGETLRSVLDRVQGVSVPQALVWASEICEALGAAHEKHVIHRDLKPDNIMVDQEGHIKVMDFGIARSLEADTHIPGTIAGTPGYWSPEQEHGLTLKETSDIYSLGVVLYELFTRTRPDTTRFGPPSAFNRYLPSHIEVAIQKCLEKEPTDRFQTAAQVRAALNSDPDISRSVKPTSTWGRVPFRVRVIGLSALVLLFLIVGFYLIPTAQVGGHYDEITSLEFSPNGNLLASASEDRTVTLWDVANRLTIQTFSDHALAVTCIAFSADSRWIAMGGADKTITVRRVSDDSTIYKFPDTKALVAVALSPDGRWLASSSDENVKVREVGTGHVIHVVSHEDQVNALAFSPDGRFLASGGADYAAKVWDMATGELVGGPLYHEDEVVDVVFSPDGRLLATGGLDNSIKLWQSDHWNFYRRIDPGDRVERISFKAGGTVLLSVGNRGQAKLWQAPTWREIASVPSLVKVESPAWAFSPDGRTLAIGPNNGRLVLQKLPIVPAQ